LKHQHIDGYPLCSSLRAVKEQLLELSHLRSCKSIHLSSALARGCSIGSGPLCSEAASRFLGYSNTPAKERMEQQQARALGDFLLEYIDDY